MRSYKCSCDPACGCDWVARAATDSELLAKVRRHAMRVHEMTPTDWTPVFEKEILAMFKAD